MSPQAQKILDNLKASIDNAFDDLVSLAQEEAFNELVSRLAPGKKAPQVKDVAPRRVSKMNGPPSENHNDIGLTEKDNDALAPVVKPAKQYADPTDDPNYGIPGYVYSEGKTGATVITVDKDGNPA